MNIQNPKAKSNKKFEFSKLIMVGVMLTYFIAMFFMMCVIWKLIGANSVSVGTAITSFCGLIATPIVTAIGFYEWKAKNENVAKEKNRASVSPTPIPLNNINNNI